MEGERSVGGLLCSEVLADLTDWLDGGLPSERVHRIEEHVRGCDVCERFGAEFAATVQAFRRELADAPLDTGRADRLSRRLAQETGAGTKVAVRPARPEDAPAIARFQILMARETEEMELDPETVERGVGAVFAEPGRGEYVVAETGGQIAGCLMATPEWSDWRNGTVLWIQSLYVVPEQRGRGVYRALWEHLQARVQASPDLRGIRLYVDKRNTAAQRVYTRLGMTREHYELFEWMKE